MRVALGRTRDWAHSQIQFRGHRGNNAVIPTMTNYCFRRMAILITTAMWMCACAGMQAINPGQPRTGPPYPITTDIHRERTETVNIAWKLILNRLQISNPPAAPLRPATATITTLPQQLAGSIFLAKLGTGSQMSDEETLESLRRFLNEWQLLIGCDPSQLSLQKLTNNNDGSRSAVYEQHAFSYPLRGGYGRVEIRFAPSDRRLLDVASTAIPDADKLQSPLNVVAATLKTDEQMQQPSSRTLAFSDVNGNSRTISISGNELSARQLVVYPQLSPQRDSLEIHLAWEISLANGDVKTIYLDAVTDQIVGVSS